MTYVKLGNIVCKNGKNYEVIYEGFATRPPGVRDARI